MKKFSHQQYSLLVLQEEEENENPAGTMQVVEDFLRLRREGRGEEAYQMLAPGASFACPWGGMQHGVRVHELLQDESRFVKKGYLDPVPIEQIADNTFQRKFQWDRGMFGFGNGGYAYFRRLPQWRELYFFHDGKISLVTSDKLPSNRTIGHPLGLS